MRCVLALALLVALVMPALAKPPAAKPATKRALKAADPRKLGASARVGFGRELKTSRGGTGARTTTEEDTAAQIQKLLRGPLLRGGVTGLYVVDAKSGEPLFAVNEKDPLNPASNVKLISTATALDLLGPDFRYPTRLLGPAPVSGIVKGDVYLLGSHDPTLTIPDLSNIAAALAERGIVQIDGNVVVGSDPTRDGIYRAIIPIQIVAGEPGHAPTATPPTGFDLVTVKVTATTARTVMRSRLTYKTELSTTPTGQPRIALTIGGVIGKEGTVSYPLWTKHRTAAAAYALVGALRERQIGVTGELGVRELGDFIGEAVGAGTLPIELGRHQSQTVGEIVSRINKWSINWLSDRLVMTAAGLVKRQPPSMELAVAAMYGWLDRHPHVAKAGIVLDTGSGLSYRTQISPSELVSVVRSAGGFVTGSDPQTARAWLSSLAVAGTDGTLRHRFRNNADVRGHILGKTGTLSTVIALSGVLELDPQRPLAFALVTNTAAPLSKNVIRGAHEQVLGEICKYIAKTSRLAPAPVTPAPQVPASDETEEGPDQALDAETANQK